jgi:hypothetical protein
MEEDDGGGDVIFGLVFRLECIGTASCEDDVLGDNRRSDRYSKSVCPASFVCASVSWLCTRLAAQLHRICTSCAAVLLHGLCCDVP